MTEQTHFHTRPDSPVRVGCSDPFSPLPSYSLHRLSDPKTIPISDTVFQRAAGIFLQAHRTPPLESSSGRSTSRTTRDSKASHIHSGNGGFREADIQPCSNRVVSDARILHSRPRTPRHFVLLHLRGYRVQEEPKLGERAYHGGRRVCFLGFRISVLAALFWSLCLIFEKYLDSVLP